MLQDLFNTKPCSQLSVCFSSFSFTYKCRNRWQLLFIVHHSLNKRSFLLFCSTCMFYLDSSILDKTNKINRTITTMWPWQDDCNSDRNLFLRWIQSVFHRQAFNNNVKHYWIFFTFTHFDALRLSNRDGVWPGQSSGGGSYPCWGPTSSFFTAIGQNVSLLWRPPPSSSSSSTGHEACLSEWAATCGAQDAGASHQTPAKTQEEDKTQPTSCRFPSVISKSPVHIYVSFIYSHSSKQVFITKLRDY